MAGPLTEALTTLRGAVESREERAALRLVGDLCNSLLAGDLQIINETEFSGGPCDGHGGLSWEEGNVKKCGDCHSFICA